ncbi:MAG: response regulator [Planctomycetes bacterium]|nr:response regulator [Planctomycetota bacterium]
MDASSENREVLRLALERRGAEILEAGEIDAGLALVREQRPDVVVVDLELAPGDEAAAWEQFDQAAEPHAGRVVILGNVRRSAAPAGAARFFSKPYHFAPLIHKIEELMGFRELGLGKRGFEETREESGVRSQESGVIRGT